VVTAAAWLLCRPPRRRTYGRAPRGGRRGAARATTTTTMAKALVRDAPPADTGLMEGAHGLG
jgi:hypothetical protein